MELVGLLLLMGLLMELFVVVVVIVGGGVVVGGGVSGLFSNVDTTRPIKGKCWARTMK